jgi:hypothetical protein
MSGVKMKSSPDESDYDRQRRENIEANNTRLSELGLHRQHGMLPAARSKPSAAKRAKKNPSLAAAEALLVPQRRSSRNLGMDAPNYKEVGTSYGTRGSGDGAWSSGGGHASVAGPFKWVDDAAAEEWSNSRWTLPNLIRLRGMQQLKMSQRGWSKLPKAVRDQVLADPNITLAQLPFDKDDKLLCREQAPSAAVSKEGAASAAVR